MRTGTILTQSSASSPDHPRKPSRRVIPLVLAAVALVAAWTNLHAAASGQPAMAKHERSLGHGSGIGGLPALY